MEVEEVVVVTNREGLVFVVVEEDMAMATEEDMAMVVEEDMAMVVEEDKVMVVEEDKVMVVAEDKAMVVEEDPELKTEFMIIIMMMIMTAMKNLSKDYHLAEEEAVIITETREKMLNKVSKVEEEA